MTLPSAKQAVLRVNREIAEITGAPPADLRCSSEATDADELFVIGVVGNARTGKSTLLHAVALDPLLEPATDGKGRPPVPVAYVFRPDLPTFEARPAQRAAPARILAHDNPDLARRVFLDLPDPALESARDSVEAWETDLQGVVWVVTDSTYADRVFHDRLQASFKDFANFWFVFNRVDHVLGRQGATPAVVRDELFQTLSDWLPGQALRKNRVYAVCARHPEKHDLSRLRRDLLSRTYADLMEGKRRNVSREIAVGARAIREHYALEARLAELRALLDHLPGLVEREAAAALAAVQQSAARLERPLRAMIQELFEHRIRPWPILATLADPALRVTAAWHRRLRARRAGAPADYADLERILNEVELAARVESIAGRLRAEYPALFAALAHRQAGLTGLASPDLAPSLRDTLERLDAEALTRLKTESFRPPGRRTRWLAIVPALWFPIVQPFLEAGLAPPDQHGAGATLLYYVVRMLGITALLSAAAFVALFYAGVLLLLYFSTQRRIHRLRLEDGPYRAGLRDHVAERLAEPYARLLAQLQAQALALDHAVNDGVRGATNPPGPASANGV